MGKEQHTNTKRNTKKNTQKTAISTKNVQDLYVVLQKTILYVDHY